MEKGLTEKRAKELLARYGENTLFEAQRKSPWRLFFSQFKDILIVILAISTAFSVITGQFTEAVTIIAIMFLNAFMGFIQEYRTEKTLQSLKNMTAPVARVYRDGALKKIPASLVVPGDIAELKAGDRIPADCELVSGVSMKTDESILSGESDAVEKSEGGNKRLFMGTNVILGHGTARVTKTGVSTEMGRISELLGETKEEQTPLQKKLKTLGIFIAVTCVACGIIVTALGIFRGEAVVDMLLTGISLAVAAIPEGLPAIVTIVLALSVNRILSRGTIIRKLHAVETLGAATVICADKTGTITENKMTVTDIETLSDNYEVAAREKTLFARLIKDGRERPLSEEKTVRDILTAAAVCSTASVYERSGQLSGEGSPTETALLIAAYRLGVKKEELMRDRRVVFEKPFDSTTKMMSVGVRIRDKTEIFAKGAPDIIINKCAFVEDAGAVRELSEADKQRIKKKISALSAAAKRVIAIARGTDGSGEENLIFLGLCGITDPPRKEIKDAVRRCREAGIRPIMITGDHGITASAIARKTGISDGSENAVLGSEIEKMSDDALVKAVSRASVFARVSPEHKLRIVRALKRCGNTVVMTGDGVNDAPAIKEADIGVAMGISGSDVAKEASCVVILDDNFATIVAAVEEGRIIYRNIKKFIRFLLTSNLGEVLTVVLAMVLKMPIVFIPIQILLINLVTDGLPSVALGMEKADDNIMKSPPRPANESLFSEGLVSTVIFRGAVLGLCNILCFSLSLRCAGTIEAARSATFLTLIAAQMIHVFECKFEGKKFNFGELFSNRVLLLACVSSLVVAAAVVYLPLFQRIFYTAAVTGTPLLISLGCVLLSPLIGSLSNIFKRNKR